MLWWFQNFLADPWCGVAPSFTQGHIPQWAHCGSSVRSPAQGCPRRALEGRWEEKVELLEIKTDMSTVAWLYLYLLTLGETKGKVLCLCQVYSACPGACCQVLSPGQQRLSCAKPCYSSTSGWLPPTGSPAEHGGSRACALRGLGGLAASFYPRPQNPSATTPSPLFGCGAWKMLSPHSPAGLGW